MARRLPGFPARRCLEALPAGPGEEEDEEEDDDEGSAIAGSPLSAPAAAGPSAEVNSLSERLWKRGAVYGERRAPSNGSPSPVHTQAAALPALPLGARRGEAETRSSGALGVAPPV